MAVTLVSTGVQFPDSTIQTTAASPSGFTLISTTSTTSATTVDITFSGSYTHYQIIFSNLYSANNSSSATPQMVWSSNSFSSTITWNGGVGFAYLPGSYNGWVGWDNAGGGANITYPGSGYQLNPGINGSLTFPNAKSTTEQKSFFGEVTGRTYNVSSNTSLCGTCSGFMTANSSAMTGVRFYMSNSGPLRGIFSLYGMS